MIANLSHLALTSLQLHMTNPKHGFLNNSACPLLSVNDRGESMDYRVVLSVVVVENVINMCIPQSAETQLRKKGHTY